MSLPLIVKEYSFINITFVDIIKEIGSHGLAVIRGIISPDHKDIYLSSALSQKTINILSLSDEPIFAGILIDLEIVKENDVYVMEISVQAKTYLTDLVEHTRSFQDLQMKYNEIFDLVNIYDDFGVMINVEDKAIEQLVVQYKETDWNFIKRMASQLETVIYPDYRYANENLYLGSKKTGAIQIANPIKLTRGRHVGLFMNHKENELECAESDYDFIKLSSRIVAMIGDKVLVSGEERYVYYAHSFLDGSEIIHEYTLVPKESFKTPKIYNDNIIGASLDGIIIDVKNDMVKTWLSVDGSQQPDKAKWFPFSTVYSSPDGTGWYMMPEINDNIRLYFPTNDEEKAYTISSVHMDPANGLRIDPDEKSLRNKHNKEIRLTPDSIYISNNNGMSIILEDDFGITISSDKDITFNADELINIVSNEDSVSILANESLSIKQGGETTGIDIIEEDIIFSGQELEVQ